MYSLHITIYLPTTHKVKINIIIHAVYSTLKSKSTAFYHRHLDILHPLPFNQLSAHKLNKASHLILERGILLPVSN